MWYYALGFASIPVLFFIALFVWAVYDFFRDLLYSVNKDYEEAFSEEEWYVISSEGHKAKRE